MYRPTGDTNTKRPAIVWVHGGGFSGGNRLSGEIVDQANVFAKKGYVNVSITYRLTPGGCSAAGATPACLQAITDAKHDAQAAVPLPPRERGDVRRRRDPDRDRRHLRRRHHRTQCRGRGGRLGTSGNPGFSSKVGAAVGLSGATLLDAIDASDAPMLDFHGTNDGLVPYAWAQATLDQGRAAGIISYLTTYQGEGHVPYNHRDEILNQTSNFLYWTLKLANAS